ncbi:MAG: TerC family protein [Candidatus Aminicenantes bacterium]|nr:TerC family protein [Candidatus Aminicenantes bacterium]
MHHQLWVWIVFNLFIFLLLALDLGVFQRKAHAVKLKEALLLSAFWIGISLIFNVFVYFWLGSKPALEFLTGYLIEKSLSVDNLFVFYLLFNYFKVPAANQHKVLFWGILGALVLRFLFIFAGVTLIHRFHWTIYLLGVFLIISGIKMAFQKDSEVHPERNPVLRLSRRLIPVTKDYHRGQFFVRGAGRRLATPLFIVLLVVETTDIMFAVDSIPAILAITLDTFIVYASNVFAILGLRALYFALAGVIELFHYLHYGLSLILVFVGVKMLISDLYKIPTPIALGAVGLILTLSIVLSLLLPPKPKEPCDAQSSK